MVNKQGIIKTLEAVFAILLILGFVYFILPEPGREQLPTGNIPYPVSSAHSFLFNEITFHDAYRTCLTSPSTGTGKCAMLGSCMTPIVQLIDQYTPTGYTNACELCTTSGSCTTEPIPYDRSIYTDSVFIGNTASRVLRIYFWENSNV